MLSWKPAIPKGERIKDTNSWDRARLKNKMRVLDQPQDNPDRFHWTDNLLPLLNILTMRMSKWLPGHSFSEVRWATLDCVGS